MKLLVMGGTQFLGRGIVEAALAAGHEVTLFNRGKSGADLFPECEKLKGDRLAPDLSALEGREFDSVIDVSAYIPRVVRDLLNTVKTKHFVFVSTISVYASNAEIGLDESAELATLEDPTVEEVNGETYGGLKVLCEQAAEELLPGNVLYVRSGLIVGNHDHTDRFTYWPARVAKGGDMLAPNSPKDALQVIDVRDEAEWIIRSIEKGLTGYFNVTGSAETTFGDVIESAKRVSGSDANPYWISPDEMQEHKLSGWADFPLWINPVGDYAGFHHFSIEAALAEGLTFRPLDDTVKSTLDFWATQDRAIKVGISAEREAEILQKLSGG